MEGRGMAVRVRVFPCLQDNYGFLIHDEASGETASVDTPEAGPILKEAEDAGWRITQIWNTHHHHDHIGGNQVVQKHTGARIIAPVINRGDIGGGDHWVGDGDGFALGGTRVDVMATPGHTLGHVAYHLAGDKIAFVGDTLFPLGCGRLFEGSAQEMWDSLSRLAALPVDTVIYAAHEYTAANAKFCLAMEPENEALHARAQAVATAREAGLATVPTTIAQELEHNVFLRPHSAAIRQRLGLVDADNVDVFAELRRRKDSF